VKTGAGLYRDARLIALDEKTRVTCNHAGVVNCHQIAKAQAQARAQYAPILAESPHMPLEQFREIIEAAARPAATPTDTETRVEHLIANRLAVYESPRTIREDLQRVKLANKAHPHLNALLNSTGAGNSVPLAKLMLEEATAERRSKER
jgi:hypothetical protein